MFSPTTIPTSLILLLIPYFTTAFPTLTPRQIEPPQPCGYNMNWPHGTMQTSQPECNDAADQICSKIPSSSWIVDGWTQIDSGSCRAMVYHNNNMPVPTYDQCNQTFRGIIEECIVQKGSSPDFGNANANLAGVRNDPKIWDDPTQTVYQIGSAAYYDKNEQVNNAWIGAATGSVGVVMVHAREVAKERLRRTWTHSG